MKTRFFLLLLLFFSVAAKAQQPLQQDSTPHTHTTRYGVFGSAMANFHDAGFARVPGIASCCPDNYGAALGLDWSAGALWEMPIAGALSIALRAGWYGLRADLQKNSTVIITDPLSSSRRLSLTVEHSLRANLGMAALEPMLSYRVGTYFALYAGASLGAVLGNSYQYQETLPNTNDNSNIVFENGTKTRNQQIGAFSTLNTFRTALTGGLGYEIPLDSLGKTLLAVEVMYSQGLGQIAGGVLARENDLPAGAGSWTANSLRAGFALKFSPERTTAYSEAELEAITQKAGQKKDSVIKIKDSTIAGLRPIVQKALSVEIASVVGIMPDGKEVPNPTVRVEEFAASKSHYILNMVFFTDQSALLPSRYRRIPSAERQRFNVEGLAESSTINAYYNILNIVGKRMSDNAKAKITLLGYATSAENAIDKNLALKRAENLKSYLQDTWKIDGKRITTQTSIIQGTITDEREAEERRRVEILSDMPEIVEEVRFDYTHRVITPSVLRIEPKVFAGAGLKQWEFEATQFNGRDYRTLAKQEGGNTIPNALLWKFDNTATTDSLPESNEPISLRMRVEDVNNKSDETLTNTIPVELRTVLKKQQAKLYDERLDTYKVFTFSLGTDAIMAQDEAVKRVTNAIRSTLQPNAKVVIIGYTDTRGTAEGNQRLSEQRADAVARLLAFEGAKVVGAGATDLHNNATPEGRFYNRFVQIDVRTPVR